MYVNIHGGFLSLRFIPQIIYGRHAVVFVECPELVQTFTSMWVVMSGLIQIHARHVDVQVLVWIMQLGHHQLELFVLVFIMQQNVYARFVLQHAPHQSFAIVNIMSQWCHLDSLYVTVNVTNSAHHQMCRAVVMKFVEFCSEQTLGAVMKQMFCRLVRHSCW